MPQTKLIRYVAQSTGLSRREVMEKICSGLVSVNGRVQTASSVLVAPGTDRVTVDGRLVKNLPALHILLYKPRATICTRNDPEGRMTVYDLLGSAGNRVASVGRLDYNTTGLLLLTTDGELAQRLARPERGIERTYRVKLGGPVTDERLAPWRAGMRIEGRPTRPAQVRILARSTVGATLQVTLVEGHNRQIHRMASAVGLTVQRIHRLRFAGLTLTGLGPGSWRPLLSAELARLNKLAGLPPHER